MQDPPKLTHNSTPSQPSDDIEDGEIVEIEDPRSTVLSAGRFYTLWRVKNTSGQKFVGPVSLAFARRDQ